MATCANCEENDGELELFGVLFCKNCFDDLVGERGEKGCAITQYLIDHEGAGWDEVFAKHSHYSTWSYGRDEYIVLDDDELEAYSLEQADSWFEELVLSEIPERWHWLIDRDKWRDDFSLDDTLEDGIRDATDPETGKRFSVIRLT